MWTLIRLAAALGVVLCASAARAQEPPPPIGPFVVDLHATVPQFPSENQLLADSRSMLLAELPGNGLGIQMAAHVYFLHWRAVTIGAGGEFATGRARQTPLEGQTTVRAAEETLTSIAPQLSFNFGTGSGWSYLSGGIAKSRWQIVPEGADLLPGDLAWVKTINYGGGARWFAKPHLAFSFDVRFYAINPGPVNGDLPQTPRTTLMVIGAGVSLK